MTSTEIANASKIMIGSTEASAMYIGSEKLWPVDLYKLDYFTIESLKNSNTIKIEKNGSAPNISLSYSTDNGTTWTNLTVSASINLTTIGIGDKIIFKGTNSTLSSNHNAYWRFAPSKNFNVYGNAMSLLFGDNFINNSEFASGTTYNLCGLFWNTVTLINAKNLILPATTATYRCYWAMFFGCANLTTAPKLPATTLADYCYCNMFRNCTNLITAPSLPATVLADSCYSAIFFGCTSLTTAPELPATTLAYGCYTSMFYRCTSLITAPRLPATALVDNCYYQMFYNCTSLTTALELPATTLAYRCYYYMFYNCTSLNYIKAMFTTTPSNSYTSYWVLGVASSGTFVKNSAATWNVTGDNGIPSGWTVLTSSS